MAGCSCCSSGPCCGSLPSTLHVTFSSNTGSFGNSSYAITWNGTEWAATVTSGGSNYDFTFFCNSSSPGACGYDLFIKNQFGAFMLQITAFCGSAQADWDTAACSPLQLVTNPLSPGNVVLSAGAVTTVTT